MATPGVKTSGTTTIVDDVTGPRHRSSKLNQMAVQSLLVACGYDLGTSGPNGDGVDGKWSAGGKTHTAFEDFQKKHPKLRDHVKDFVIPSDVILLMMAEKAQILLPLPQSPGLRAFIDMHSHLKDLKVKYDKEWNKAFWGITGYEWAVMTTNELYRKGPIQFDCTTYVNLMFSVILHGDVHWADYEASNRGIGGIGANLAKRYGIHERNVGVFHGRDAAGEISAKTEVNKIYLIMCGDTPSRAKRHLRSGDHDVHDDDKPDVGFVHHQGFVCNGRVYHAKYNDKVTDEELADFCRSRIGSYIFYVFGPINV